MSTALNLASIKPSLDKLQAVERELTASLIERDEVIRASLVALLSQQHLVVLGPPGCQPAGSKVLMADGSWKNVEDVHPGDKVISPQRDGTSLAATVTETAVYKDHDIYEIATRGRTLKRYRCADNHIIPYIALIRHRDKDQGTRRRRSELREAQVNELLLRGNGYLSKLRVFTTTAVEFSEGHLPIHPYVLGAFLGDGELKSPLRFTNINSKIFQKLESLGVSFGVNTRRHMAGEVQTRGVLGPLAKVFRTLPCYGCVAQEKFIPENYKCGSIKQRLDLLAGLLDTDGSRDHFSTISSRLAQDFLDLVHSVGGFASIKEQVTHCNGKPFVSYRVFYSFGEYTPELVNEYKQRKPRNFEWKNHRRRSFTITHVGREDVYGFVLNSPSEWYVTDDWLVTHNTAKSALVTNLAERISPQSGAGLRSFTYLMTRFTTPEELFGPVSVSGLKRDEYRRITAGKLVEAELAFLDEIFKASSAILNALLKIANERVFHNGGQEMQVPLISLFGASNEMPQGNELEALWDRFLLRFRVGYVSDTGFVRFIRAAAAKHNGHGSNGSQPLTLQQAELGALQQSAAQVAIPNAAIDLIEQLRRDLATKGIIISDRRWGQALGVLQAHALTEGRDAVTEDDLVFLKHVLWQSPEQQAEIGKALARIGNPLNSKAVDFEDQAASVHRECMDAQQAAQSEEQKMQAAIEANTKLKQIGVKLQELREQAAEQGRNTNRIDKVIEAVAKMKQEIASLVL